MEFKEKPIMRSSLTRSSRSLIFLFLALVSLICILIYYNRSVSFANIDLMLKLQLAQSRKQTVEQRRDALERRIVTLETKNRLLEDDLINHKAIKDRAFSVTSDLKKELRTEREKLYNTTITAKVGTKRIISLNSGVRLARTRLGEYLVKSN